MYDDHIFLPTLPRYLTVLFGVSKFSNAVYIIITSLEFGGFCFCIAAYISKKSSFTHSRN